MKMTVRRLSSTWRSKVRDGNKERRIFDKLATHPFCVCVCVHMRSTPQDHSSVRDQQTVCALHRRGKPPSVCHLVLLSRLSQVKARKKPKKTLSCPPPTEVHNWLKEKVRTASVCPNMHSHVSCLPPAGAATRQAAGGTTQRSSRAAPCSRTSLRGADSRRYACDLLVSLGKPAQISELSVKVSVSLRRCTVC